MITCLRMVPLKGRLCRGSVELGSRHLFVSLWGSAKNR